MNFVAQKGEIEFKISKFLLSSTYLEVWNQTYIGQGKRSGGFNYICISIFKIGRQKGDMSVSIFEKCILLKPS